MGAEVRRAARGVRRLEIYMCLGVHAAAFAMTCTGWRKPCAARFPPDGVRIRQAWLCLLPPARTRAAAKSGRHSPTRAWPFVENAGAPASLDQPHTRKTARHRPVSTLNLAAGRRRPAQGPRISPVAGQALRPMGTRGLPAEQCRCLASSFVSPHVTTRSGRPSSRLARHVFGPSGSGSEWSMAWA